MGNVRHESCAQGHETKGDEADEARNSGTQTAEAGEEGGEPTQSREEEGYQEEDPSEAPGVVIVEGGSVASMAAAQSAGDVGGAAGPRLAKGWGRARRTAIVIVGAAEKEICPLSDRASAGDARCVGTQKVDLVEGRVGSHTRQDHEPQEEQRGREQDDAHDAQWDVWGGVCVSSSMFNAYSSAVDV